MKTIILDTDFIINSIKNNIDMEMLIKELCIDQVKISLLDKTIEELKNKSLENIILSRIKKFDIIKTKKNNNVDNLIMDLIKNRKNIIVATQDRKLKEKLKKGKIPIITIRQKKHLILI